MSDVELIVKIDEKIYKDICSDAEIMIYGGMCSGKSLLATLLRAIRNSTPLPKEHGRLIDAAEVEKLEEALCATECACCALDGCFYDEAETIVEADKCEEVRNNEYEAKAITRGKCMICGKELTEGLFFCKECEAKADKVWQKARDKELVIKIPEYMFKDIQDRNKHPNKGNGINLLEHAVAIGTSLPKGHGKLKDVSNMLTVTEIRSDGSEHTFVPYSEIEDAPTIIEADRSEEE